MPRRARQDDVVLAPVLRSSAMRRLDRILAKVAPKEVTVTLIGESGTGKEILARRVHELSPRRRGPFIPINCAAIPEALFESELFGHERGAFTGANDRARGKVEAAEAGTLFLDEIGEMPLGLQAKLLRFLENRRFMRVGGSTKLEADVRLVFATLRPLADEVRAGRFRADLFYRIEGVTLVVPPLRERIADIPPLIEQFIGQLSSRHGTAPPRWSRAARDLLMAHSWPGNVRELRNVIEVLCLLRGGQTIRPRDLPESLRLVEPRTKTREARSRPHPPVGTLDEIVAAAIAHALEVSAGSPSKAAERLGVSTRTIQRHLARGLAIRPPATKARSGRRRSPRA
jgi:transcriptional regulator with PAS, ATPase and Fis domain